MSDQRYYEIVAEELQCRSIRPGLWARAVAETGGEGDAARSLYIRLRVGEIMQIERAETERRRREEADTKKQERKAAILARKEEERRREPENEAERLRIEAERAASPYLWLVIVSTLSVGFVVLVVCLANFHK